MLGLHARPIPFHKSAQKHLFQRTLPRFAQHAVEVFCLSLVVVLMAVARQLLDALQFALEVTHSLLDRESDPRQLVNAHTSTLFHVADRLPQRSTLYLYGKLFQDEQEDK